MQHFFPKNKIIDTKLMKISRVYAFRIIYEKKSGLLKKKENHIASFHIMFNDRNKN